MGPKNQHCRSQRHLWKSAQNCLLRDLHTSLRLDLRPPHGESRAQYLLYEFLRAPACATLWRLTGLKLCPQRYVRYKIVGVTLSSGFGIRRFELWIAIAICIWKSTVAARTPDVELKD